MRWTVVAVAVLLAGCSEAPVDDVVVVMSGEPVEVASGPERSVRAPTGDLRGVVVDEAVRPIPGAVVRLPGLEVTRMTDEEGVFGFIDLIAGPYYLEADAQGFEPLQAVFEVKADLVNQVRVVLKAKPSELPYHDTQKFSGYAEVVWPVLVTPGPRPCPDCVFRVVLEAPADTLVVEAVGPGDVAFRVDVKDGQGSRLWQGSQPDPFMIHLDPGNETVLYLDIQPIAQVLPQTNMRFEVFATSFHNGPAPEGWSLAGGDR